MTKLLKFLKKNGSLEERIQNIQMGDEKEKNLLIQEYIPFIQKTISNQLGRYIEIENNDAFSIGLMAFNEAIDKYDKEKGNFLTFASMVIKSRIIDQLRRESRTSKEIFMSQLEGEENENFADNIIAVESFEERVETRVDMAALIRRMKTFGVTLDDLIREAPKHIDTRVTAIKIAKCVYENKDLRDKFIRTQNLPNVELMESLHISKKVIQRSRKFIIAIILILDSNLDTLKHYITQVERGK